METELERMIVRLMGDSTDYQTMLKQAQDETRKATDMISRSSANIERFKGSIRSWAQTATQAIGAVGLAMSSWSIISRGVQASAMAEELETTYGTLLKDVGMGKKLVKDLTQFAAETPLNMPGIQQAAKMYLQFGGEVGNVIPVLKMVGDVTGGDAQRFQQMTYALSQASATGRLMGQDLMQMINAGFNPLQELVQMTGKDMSYWKQQMERGQVSVDLMMKAFQHATSEGGNYFNLMKMNSQNLKGLFSTMQDDIGMTLKVIGDMLVEGLNLKWWVGAISTAFQTVRQFILDLSPGAKQFITYLLVIAATVGSVLAVWAIAGPIIVSVVGAILGAISALFSPLGAVVAIIGVLIAVAVSAAGGIQEAFNIALKAVQDFWAWTLPMRIQFMNIFNAIYDNVIFVFDGIKKFVIDVWNSIAGNAQVNWEEVRVSILEAMIFAEYVLKNFSKYAELTWKYAAWQATKFGNEMIYLFTVLIPAGTKYFFDNFFDILDNWNRLTMAMITSTVFNIYKLGSSIPGLLSGSLTIGDVMNSLAPLTAGFNNTLAEFKVPPRVMGALEKQLMDEYRALKGELDAGFEEFKRQRMGELLQQPVPPPEQKKAEQATFKAGQGMGQALKKGMGKEVGKVEAALVGSAEALGRIQEYQDRIAMPRLQPGGVLGAVGGSVAGALSSAASSVSSLPTTPQVAGIGSVGANQGAVEKLLTEIRDEIIKGNKSKSVKVADL